MKVKEESEIAGLKLNIKKAKVMVSSPITSWHVNEETMETVTLFSWTPKSQQTVTAAMELKGPCELETGVGLLISRPSLAGGPRPLCLGLCACAHLAAACFPRAAVVQAAACREGGDAVRAGMTDYGEEQRNELEALESIYPDSFTVLSENPPSFTITVTSEAGENDETVQTILKFTYSEKYPDEAPLYEIFAQLNLEDNDVADILKLLALQAEENLGMVMIFTLVTAVQEKLNSRSNKN